MPQRATSDPIRTLDEQGLAELFTELQRRGFDVFGPRAQDGVIAPGQLQSADDLPLGWTDEQSGGRYRLLPRTDSARFGYAVGPRSYKELLHPPRTHVWSMRRERSGEVAVALSQHDPVRRAFVGVRPCELSAILKQDAVLMDGPHPDPVYTTNRTSTFIAAVNCGDPADTCFCTSMDTGPEAGPGYDLVLTELVNGSDVRYVTRAGSDEGAAVLNALPSSDTTDAEMAAGGRVVQNAADQMTRRLDADGVKELLYQNLESDQWDDIAERCLACGNCTLVCPTCFCTNMEDVTDLSGDQSDRWRVWDSCFSLEFSHLGPGPHRASVSSRYRQWLTHKLGTWIDQFGESGCVGCGRCITWCPVGIDLTEEIARMAESQDEVQA